jgi:hypothetical protein
MTDALNAFLVTGADSRININIMFLDITHRPVFISKHNRAAVKKLQLRPV